MHSTHAAVWFSGAGHRSLHGKPRRRPSNLSSFSSHALLPTGVLGCSPMSYAALSGTLYARDTGIQPHHARHVFGWPWSHGRIFASVHKMHAETQRICCHLLTRSVCHVCSYLLLSVCAYVPQPTATANCRHGMINQARLAGHNSHEDQRKCSRNQAQPRGTPSIPASYHCYHTYDATAPLHKLQLAAFKAAGLLVRHCRQPASPTAFAAQRSVPRSQLHWSVLAC